MRLVSFLVYSHLVIVFCSIYTDQLQCIPLNINWSHTTYLPWSSMVNNRRFPGCHLSNTLLSVLIGQLIPLTVFSGRCLQFWLVGCNVLPPIFQFSLVKSCMLVCLRYEPLSSPWLCSPQHTKLCPAVGYCRCKTNTPPSTTTPLDRCWKPRAVKGSFF